MLAERVLPHTNTNAPLAVGIFNDYVTVHYCQQARYVHQFSVGDLTTLIPHTELALIVLG